MSPSALSPLPIPSETLECILVLMIVDINVGASGTDVFS